MELLPIPYFHVIFTVPQELRAFLRSHQRKGYGILFKASAYSMSQLAKRPQFLGGEIGILSVLHTWGRTLTYHPHVPCMVTGGAWGNQQRWERGNVRFFLPVKLLSKTYREEVKALFEKTFPEAPIPEKVWQKKWVVHCKKAPHGNQSVLTYLGRYIHRVVLSESNILNAKLGKVTFKYKDSQTQRKRRMALDAHEFLRRFLQHVLPKGFRKVRYYGLWNPAHRSLLFMIQAQLALLFGVSIPEKPKSDKKWRPSCAVCGKGKMKACLNLLPPRGPP